MDPNQIPQGMPQGVPPMPPTPTDPGMPMPQPGVPVGGDQPISEEEKQVLLDLIAKIRDQLGEVQAMGFASGNKSEVLRRDLLKQVFEKLQLAGVDLNSRESVGAFIMRLQEQNPELAQMFEKAMDVLMGSKGSFGGGTDPNAPPPPEMGGIPPAPGMVPPEAGAPPMIG
jgi:hypothetical protein